MPESRRLRVLVINDDGIDAPALSLLATRLTASGHDVQVAAPYDEQTGCGASLGRMDDGVLVALKDVRLTAAPDVPAVAVDAPPALVVLAACQGVFGPPPEVVVSSVNDGFNTGTVVMHSGRTSPSSSSLASARPPSAYGAWCRSAWRARSRDCACTGCPPTATRRTTRTCRPCAWGASR